MGKLHTASLGSGGLSEAFFIRLHLRRDCLSSTTGDTFFVRRATLPLVCVMSAVALALDSQCRSAPGATPVHRHRRSTGSFLSPFAIMEGVGVSFVLEWIYLRT